MRKWMLITVLALGLSLFLLPGHALADVTVTVKQYQPTTAAPHGTTVSLSVGVETTENSLYYMGFTVNKPKGQTESFYQTCVSLGVAPITWTITNGTEASQLISITAKVYDTNDHSKLIYSDTKNYQIQINHTPLTDWIVTALPGCETAGRE
jgi:hypothetical protein